MIGNSNFPGAAKELFNRDIVETSCFAPFECISNENNFPSCRSLGRYANVTVDSHIMHKRWKFPRYYTIQNRGKVLFIGFPSS